MALSRPPGSFDAAWVKLWVSLWYSSSEPSAIQRLPSKYSADRG